MSDQPGGLRLADLSSQPELSRILVEHAYRGIRLQLLLRAVLVAFLVLTVAVLPPAHDRAACYVIVAGYACWVAVVAWLVRRGGMWPVRYLWLTLFADLAAITALTLVAGASAVQSWTADVLVNGLFLIPVMAAAQLRPRVCAAVCVPTVAVYLAASIATRTANGEPWASILLRTGVLAGLAAGCVLLSRLQLSRVLTIGGLVADRNELLAELMGIEDRERRELAEHLHDGALQYVLAARQDLDDVRGQATGEPVDRLDHALRESAQLLRSTVTQLHPAVLAQSGLRRAVGELARAAGARGGFEVRVDSDGWGDELRTPADPLLYATARELLNNVVKHANARCVRVGLALADGTACLAVVDDGCGIADGVLERRLAEGHIGVSSRRVRLEAAGGRLVLRNADPAGTIAEVRLPVTAPGAAPPAR